MKIKPEEAPIIYEDEKKNCLALIQLVPSSRSL